MAEAGSSAWKGYNRRLKPTARERAMRLARGCKPLFTPGTAEEVMTGHNPGPWKELRPSSKALCFRPSVPVRYADSTTDDETML